MQDFTKLVAVSTDENKNPKTQPNWVTKDRFWTFVFWFGMSLGSSITAVVAGFGQKSQEFSCWATVLFCLTVVGIPLLLKKFNGTKFIKILTFANSEGTVLTEEQRPYLFGYAIFAGLPTSFAVAETLLRKAPENFITALILSLCGFAPMSLYFIYKNCPISILFNHKFWTVEGNPSIALLKKVAKIIKDD